MSAGAGPEALAGARRSLPADHRIFLYRKYQRIYKKSSQIWKKKEFSKVTEGRVNKNKTTLRYFCVLATNDRKLNGFFFFFFYRKVPLM